MLTSYRRTTPFLILAITFSISSGLTLSYLVWALTSLVSCALCSIDSTNEGGPSFLIGFIIKRKENKRVFKVFGNLKDYLKITKRLKRKPFFNWGWLNQVNISN